MITNNLDKHEIKSLHNEQNYNTTESSRLEVGKITICLTEEHKTCSREYTDPYGKYLIKCLCKCHNQKSKDENEDANGLSKNLDVVEFQKSESKLLNLDRLGKKPYTLIDHDTCWCGHKQRQHSRQNYSFFEFVESCDVEGCNCKRYDDE